MPLLVWNNYSAILPLDSTVTPPDLSMRTDMAETLTRSCHRAVLASASSMLAAIFRERCTCEDITLILPGVSNTILEKLVSWLYTGEMEELSKEAENEWDTLVKMLGLEGLQLIDEESFELSEVKNGSIIVKSMNSLTLNESYLKSTRNPVFCDVDIFTSDDDSFVVVNENDDLSEVVASETPVKANISCCVQCDLSEDEYKEEPKINKSDQGDEAKEILGNSTDPSLKNDSAGSNSSSSEFQDATTTLDVDINTTSMNSNNNDRKVMEFETCHDETVYQDCEEELDDNNGSVAISRIDDSVDKMENNSLLDIEGNVGQSPRDSESDDGSTLDEENNDESFSDDDDESDDDPSWNVSGSDDNEESDGEESLKADNCPPLGDVTNINFSTVNTSVLGVWLSDTGPVHMVTRCLCKGTCVRNCACRTAGGTCSRRCSCKPSKCKLRADAAQDRSLPSMASTGTGTAAEPKVINKEFCLVPGAAVTPSTTSALGEEKSDPSHLTPTCPPIPLNSSTSKLSTTAKKKRKLFTASVGPQEI